LRHLHCFPSAIAATEAERAKTFSAIYKLAADYPIFRIAGLS
jgi:hypothetical protein